jgi:hypothetical protein
VVLLINTELIMNFVIPVVAAIAITSSLAAQWVNYPTRGTPRTPDGKPNLAAAAPHMGRVPDLSGIWHPADNLPSQGSGDLPPSPLLFRFGANLKDDLPYRSESREAMSKRRMKDDHYLNCVVPGGPHMLTLPSMNKIVQTPGLVLILSEYNVHYRQIFTDGRPLPDDPEPTWNGYSVGKWEKDTLVVHSLGYRNDQTLDAVAGSPLTNSAKVTERFRRPSFGRLEIEVTIDDPKAYTRPFTVLVKEDLAPDTDLLDAPCTDNEKDLPHLPDN